MFHSRASTRPGQSRRRRIALAVLAGLAALGGFSLTGCSDDDDAVAASDRPEVTFTATEDSLTVPTEVPSGLVDVHLETEVGGEEGHHLVIARLNDGVTLEEALNGGDEAFFTMMTIKGGNGTIAGGESLTMTLDLEPGNYFALDNPQLPEPVVQPFTVVPSDERGGRPDAEGVVHMGPGMVITIPDDFDATGTWEFVNDDPTNVHEAAMVRLADGKTAADVVAWGESHFQDPMPIDGEFGSMGALGPGERAFITLEPGEPGDYVLICFVPDQEGIPHLGQGMVTPFTVGR
ncbi:MAG: hypothetical protein ABW195_04975 [Ilumatobacteraceae bacterium]